MPRRNRPPDRHRQMRVAAVPETRPLPTTEQMARDLVRRGLASPQILGHPTRPTEAPRREADE